MTMDWVPYVEAAPATTATVAMLEERLAVRFPDDYRQALAAHGGMAPVRDRIRLPGGGGTAFGPLLFAGGTPAAPRYSYSVEYAIDALKEWQGVTEDAALRLAPFATNTASGYFCLDYRDGSPAPRVVFVDLDYDPEERGAITPVAPSFSATLDLLEG